MIDAYMKGQDLYAVIAQSAFDNEYWENLEFYPEFTEITDGGKTVVAGTEKESTVSTNGTNFIEVPWCYLVQTANGEKQISQLQLSDKIISDIGELSILNISDQYIKNGIKFIKISFQE